MKALSLKQPFAELVVSRRKTIELRKWKTKFRGELLIHASKVPDYNSMKKFGFEDNSLPLGCIVGKAELVDVKHYTNDANFMKDKKLHCADSSFGGYGFILKNIKRIKPIPCKGALNFWEFNYKDENTKKHQKKQSSLFDY